MNAALVRALLFLENEPSPGQLFSVDIMAVRHGPEPGTQRVGK